MTASTSPSLDALTSAPELTALIPALYVAWADGSLTPSELGTIRDAARRRLRDGQREVLDRWLDPESPPSSTELMRLYRFVRERASRGSADVRGSLVDLGRRIAELPGDPDAAAAGDRAVHELESALGVVGGDAARHYFEVRPAVRQDFDESMPPFDPAELTQRLDGEAAETWRQVRALVAHPQMRLRAGLDQTTHRHLVRACLDLLAKQGVGQLSVPVEHGGQGRPDRFMKLFEALGMHDLSVVVKVGVQFGLFGGAIANLGTPEQAGRWLPRVATGELLGGFAMTELGHGSNVREIETVARYEPERERFVLHTPSVSARKEWIGNAAVDGRAMVVFAQLETGGRARGVHAFFVRVRDDDGRARPGCHIEDCGAKMGLAGVDNGRLWFDHVEVPRDQLLARYGQVAADGEYGSPIEDDARRFFTMLGTLVTGRISVAAAAVTASKVALTTAVRYAALRRQFGPADRPEISILDYPTLQQRLLPQVAAAYVYHFAVDDLQRQYLAQPRDADTRDLEANAAGLKALATWHGIEAIQAARECCGGMGFLSVNRIGQLRRDVDVFATFEGDNTVLLQLAARTLLGGFAAELGEGPVTTLLSEVARRAKEALLEQNPVATRRTDPEHLLDPEFHRDAMRFRAHNLLVSAARRFDKRTKAGMDPFEAFTRISDHCVALARAHTEQQVLACAQAAVEATTAGPVRDALRDMTSLWGLWRLHGDAAWFLESDYFSGRKARAIRKLVGRECERLRPQAVALVDAFGLPDEVLGPIAFEGYTQHTLLARRDGAGTNDRRG